jgi:hypothetical protein
MQSSQQLLQIDALSEGGPAVSVLEKFRKYVFTPPSHILVNHGNYSKLLGDHLLKWALSHGVEHYSFLSFPYNSTICEKQDSFLDIKYIYQDGLKGLPRMELAP